MTSIQFRGQNKNNLLAFKIVSIIVMWGADQRFQMLLFKSILEKFKFLGYFPEILFEKAGGWWCHFLFIRKPKNIL